MITCTPKKNRLDIVNTLINYINIHTLITIHVLIILPDGMLRYLEKFVTRALLKIDYVL